MRKKATILGLLCALLTGCAANVDKLEPEPEAIAYELICDEAMFGAGEEGIEKGTRVVQSQQELETIIEKISAVNKPQCQDELNIINISERSVLAIFDQVRGTAGFDINIISVLKKGELIEVSYSISEPGDMAAEVMTQPFVVLTIPKTEKEIIFINE